MQTVTYEELETALEAAGSSLAASEAHGVLCGTLAASQAFRPEEWIAEFLSESEAPERSMHAGEVLLALCRETAVQLSSPDMDFAPLLPDDGSALDIRTAALASWCSGFLAGIGAVPVPEAGWPETVREVVSDYAEIARAAVGDEDTEEDSESAYVELVEYLRASTQLVHEELVDPRGEAVDEAD
jgi:yecA family protein